MAWGKFFITVIAETLGSKFLELCGGEFFYRKGGRGLV